MAPGKRLQLVHEPLLGRSVEVVGGLVEDHGVRALEEDPDQVDPAALATGQALDVLEQQLLAEPEPVGQAGHGGLGLVAAVLAELLLEVGEEGDVLGGRVLGHLGPGLAEGVVQDVEAAAGEHVGEAVGLEAETVGLGHLGQVAVGAADGGAARSSARCGPGSLMTTEMKVDLPVPLRPTSPTFSPAPTTNEASRRRVRSPISMVREEPTIMGGEGVDRSRRDGSRSGAGASGGVDRPQSPTTAGTRRRGAGHRPAQRRCRRTEPRRRSAGRRAAPGPGGAAPWPGRRPGGWATAPTSRPCPARPWCAASRPARWPEDRRGRTRNPSHASPQNHS